MVWNTNVKYKEYLEENYSFDKVLVENSNYPRHALKRKLLKNNMLEYKCQMCGLGPFWNEKPMPLILDHINGTNNDNRLNNLRFVCSNCDSQLDTYKSKNKKKLGSSVNG